MQVSKSRHTPGVTAGEIDFNIGETVDYKLLNGSKVQVRITSKRMTHDRCPTHGYEGVFSDSGQVGFADSARIVGWKLK